MQSLYDTEILKLALKTLAIITMSMLLVYSCTSVIDRQAEADYQECLAWQNDGYPVECAKI